MLNKNFVAPFYGVQLTQGYGCFRKKIIHDVQNIFVASKSCFFFFSQNDNFKVQTFEEKGFIVFQNVLLSDTFFNRLLKYSFLPCVMNWR